MPFKSDAQRKWMMRAHPAMAKRWEAETKETKLPERVGPASVKAPDIYKRNKKGRIY